MSSQRYPNSYEATEDDADDDILYRSPLVHATGQQPSFVSPSDSTLQSSGQPVADSFSPHYRSQTPNPSSFGRSPTSLEMYALFPPLRSATPGPSVVTPSLHSSGAIAPPHPAALSSTPTTPEAQGQAPPLKKHACPLCVASFERRFDLKRHMHTHSDHKEFHCQRCDKALARSDSLQRHLVTCKGPKPSS